MKEAIKVERLQRDIVKIGKAIKKLAPSRFKSGLIRYHEAMSNSINRLRATNGS